MADSSRLPMAGDRHRTWIYFLCIVVAGLAVRSVFLGAVTSDSEVCVLPWYEQIVSGGYKTLGGDFVCTGYTGGGYSPPYYYLLYIASLFDGLAPALWLIKTASIAFGVLATFFAYRITRLSFSETRALIAAAAVFFAPTVVANGAWWGQSDMMWTSLILGSLYFTMTRKPLIAMIFFGVAFSFKAQAIFFAPFLFMLVLRGEIRLWQAACAPIAFLAMLTPAVAFGNSWIDVLTVYFRQAEYFHSLSLNAANLWYFVPNDYYDVGIVFGLILTTIASLALCVLPQLTKADLDKTTRMLAATMFVATSVFLLPKMHDRYFFAADVFSILLAVYAPRYWFVPVMFQIGSLDAYVPSIVQSLTGQWRSSPTLPMAAMLNTVLVTFLVYEFWRACTRKPATAGTKAEGLARSLMFAVVVAEFVWLGGAALRSVVSARVCPAEGLADVICSHTMPANLIFGTWAHWAFFFVILAASYVGVRLTALSARLVMQRVRHASR